MDEKGIKAAAATVAESWDSGGGPVDPVVPVTLDRPFAFLVYDRVTELVLYSGRFSGE